MAPLDAERQRLADFMEDRRADLRLRWEDVAAAGGISVKALHDVRNGTGRPRRNTLRGIDAGLQWEPGSAERILAGGGPRPANSWPLGRLLEQRRIELDPAWISGDQFAAYHGLQPSFVDAVERGAWPRFTAEEAQDIERAYQLEPDSWPGSLSTGKLVPAGSVPDAGPGLDGQAAEHLRRTPGASEAEIAAYLEILHAFSPAREAAARRA
jgi:hypothetical protein